MCAVLYMSLCVSQLFVFVVASLIFRVSVMCCHVVRQLWCSADLLLCQGLRVFGRSGWRRMRPRTNKRTNNFTTKKKKETIQAIKLYNQPTTMLDFGPMRLSYHTRDPRLREECDRRSGWHLCVCLEWHWVQLLQDRSFAGWSQARSDAQGQSQWPLWIMLCSHACAILHPQEDGCSL